MKNYAALNAERKYCTNETLQKTTCREFCSRRNKRYINAFSFTLTLLLRRVCVYRRCTTDHELYSPDAKPEIFVIEFVI